MNNKTQNTKQNQQYKMVNEPPPVTDKEFRKHTENNNKKWKENSNKSDTEENSQIQIMPETLLEAVIPKTPLELRRTTRYRIHIPIISYEQIEKPRQYTTTNRCINSQQRNRHRWENLTSPNKNNSPKTTTALKIVKQIHQMAFRDTGYLNRATVLYRCITD